MLRSSNEDCNVLTHFCESSGIIGRSEETGAAAVTCRADLACAAKSHAASTGQQRLRSRLRPQAALTPPNNSAERSRRHVWASVWTGNAGTVLGDWYSIGFKGWAGWTSKPASE